MIVKLLTKHHLEFLSIKGGCRGLSGSTLVKMSNCWKSHLVAQLLFMISVRPSPPVLYRADTTSATSVELAWSLDQVKPHTPVEHVLVYFRKK